MTGSPTSLRKMMHALSMVAQLICVPHKERSPSTTLRMQLHRLTCVGTSVLAAEGAE